MTRARLDVSHDDRFCETCGIRIVRKASWPGYARQRFCSECAVRIEPLEDAFWRRVDTSAGPSGCWPWMGTTNYEGYGYLGHAGRDYRASRLSWELHNGPIPAGLFVCHTCDNPPCVNPAHLYAGTAADNTHDALNRGRLARGERHGSAVLTTAQVVAIRGKVASGRTRRAVAVEFGVNEQTVADLVRRRTWAHVA